MKKVNIYEAKTQLSRLVEEAASGEDVVIARAGRPVARLTRLQNEGRKRRLGLLDGQGIAAGDVILLRGGRGLGREGVLPVLASRGGQGQQSHQQHPPRGVAVACLGRHGGPSF